MEREEEEGRGGLSLYGAFSFVGFSLPLIGHYKYTYHP